MWSNWGSYKILNNTFLHKIDSLEKEQYIPNTEEDKTN